MHVLEEKSSTPASKEAGLLIEIAIQRQRLLKGYHNKRRDTDFAIPHRLISLGSLGMAVESETHLD